MEESTIFIGIVCFAILGIVVCLYQIRNSLESLQKAIKGLGICIIVVFVSYGILMDKTNEDKPTSSYSSSTSKQSIENTKTFTYCIGFDLVLAAGIVLGQLTGETPFRYFFTFMLVFAIYFQIAFWDKIKINLKKHEWL